MSRLLCIRTFRLCVTAALVLLSGHVFAAEVEGYVGQSATQVAPDKTVRLIDVKTGGVVDIDETNFFGKYAFEDVAPGHYRVEVDRVSREIMLKSASESKRLDFDLSTQGGEMDYSKAGPSAPAALSGSRPAQRSGMGSGMSGGLQQNNTVLAQQIAGTWWGYTGYTETKIGLCPDGSYTDFSESSYSGGGYGDAGGWGAVGSGGGSGTWTIQGDTNSGVIYVQYANGGSKTLNYNQIGDPGCLNINGSRLCRSSAGCQ